MEYDVFISCKREDYELAEKVYEFLKKNDIHAFLSSKELERMKESEYMDAISEALDSAYHLVVLASSKENVMSKWVKFEWSTYLNEQLSGRKEGQILTLLEGMEVKDLPIQLRHYESFTMEDYAERLLSYVETPSFKERREEERKKKEEEERRIKAKMEEERRKDILKNEVRIKVEEYERCAGTLEEMSKEIIDKRKELGESEKKCPVCGMKNPIESSYCTQCGWTFIPPFDVNPKGDEKHLFKAKSIWKCLQKQSKVDEKELKEKAVRIEELEKALKQINKVKENMERDIHVLMRKVEQSERTIEESRKECDEYRCRAEKADMQYEKMMSEKRDLEVKILELKDKCKEKEEQLKTYMEKEKGNNAVSIKTNKDRLSFKVGDVAFDMIRVEAGGSMTHSYYIGETAVTQALWYAVMRTRPSWFYGDDRPVESVSWNVCNEFIDKLNKITGKIFRLPTEAEWGYAARGGKKSRGYMYAGSNNIYAVGWYAGNSNYETHDVRRLTANELGLYDMSGNVWEWCNEKYVCRGGYFSSKTGSCLITERINHDTDLSDYTIGFRLALSE